MLNSIFKKDEPVKIRFYFGSQVENRRRLTWDDRITIEGIQNGGATLEGLRNLAARFMADENNRYLPFERALKILGKLTEDDINDVLKKFSEGMRDAAIPPKNAPASNSPSEAGAEKEPQAGSQP